jgi:hypothetical protein
VSGDQWKVGNREVTAENVDVRATDPASIHLHKYFVLGDARYRHLFNPKVLGPVQDGRGHRSRHLGHFSFDWC